MGLVVIGKHFTDVAQRGSSQQCVRDSMQQYVGIAVSDQMPVVWNFDTT